MTASKSASAPHKKRKHRPSVAIGLWIIKRLETFIRRSSTVGNTPYFDPAIFAWATSLQAQSAAIRAELDAVLENTDAIPSFQQISKDQARLTQDDHWKTFFLYGYGYRIDGNCERCPITAQAIESIPGMYTAFFSILSPGKHIPPHRGPYNGLLRVHLGLIIPEPAERCRIEVGGETRHWQAGQCLVFDDTYKHQVWNDTEGRRVVLFLDVQRPMTLPGRLLNRVVLKLIQWSPFIQDARKNQQAWDRGILNQ
ncbi:aspartyl/asparaginyl beta-hydroxylase domain-containing protein [Pseudomonas sp. RIT-To-2]|uniref:aspartyl/asparaginyl beta-hydroxylase domain-containing protein n=1 Tax=Pseudomonas sp. RIT-To-2 TaxID=3462541 RepID=UPI0024134B38